MGDLNLDYNKKHDFTYQRANFFELFEEILGELNLIRLVEFTTWSRLVGLSIRSSVLDHIYVNNVTLINNILKNKPCFGDHVLIVAHLCMTRPQPKTSLKRDWRRFSKEKLVDYLGLADWSTDTNYVQEMCNAFENKLINVVDSIAMK